MSVNSMTKKIREALERNPDARPSALAKELKVKRSLVYAVRYATKKAAKASKQVAKKRVKPLPIIKALPITLIEPKADAVNHPAHYKIGGIETIDFIEAKSLNYNLGNVVKYITRADYKGDRKQDLEKAMWYLKRELGII